MSTYSDVDMLSSSQMLVTDLEAIKQSITNILTTAPGERLFNTGFGSHLENVLFRLFTDDTEFEVLAVITNDLQQEPRIVVDNQNTKVEVDPDNHEIKLTVVFSVPGLSRDSFEYVKIVSR